MPIAIAHIRISPQIIPHPIAAPHQQIIKIQIPQNHPIIPTSRSQNLPIRAKTHTHHTVFMSSQSFQQSPAATPQFHLAIVTTRSNQQTIRAKTDATHTVARTRPQRRHQSPIHIPQLPAVAIPLLGVPLPLLLIRGDRPGRRHFSTVRG